MKNNHILISIAIVFLLTGSSMFGAGNKEMALDEGRQASQIESTNPAAGEEISWQVISSGGDIGCGSTNFKLSGTVAQTAVGTGGSTNFGLSNGFWRESGGECECIPGDANGDYQVNVGDAVYTIAYVFSGGPPPTSFDPCSGDSNCDGQCNVGDAVYTIAYVFTGGPPPCTCGTWVELYGAYK